MNITDIDDKIIKKTNLLLLKELISAIQQIAENNEGFFFFGYVFSKTKFSFFNPLLKSS